MVLFDDVRGALESTEHSDYRTAVLMRAYHFLSYVRTHEVAERRHVANIANRPVDETLDHQLGNLEAALRTPGTPQARCASGFFGSLKKEYGFD